MDKNPTSKLRFRMLHVTGEWFTFQVEGNLSREEALKVFYDGSDGVFWIGNQIFKGEHWSCLTFDGV